MGFVDNQLGKDQKKKPSNPSVKWFDVVEDEVIAFYRVLPGFTGFSRRFSWLFLILADLIRFHLIFPSFTWFDLVLLDWTR